MICENIKGWGGVGWGGRVSQQKVGVLNYTGCKETNSAKNLKKLKCGRFFQS